MELSEHWGLIETIAGKLALGVSVLSMLSLVALRVLLGSDAREMVIAS